MIRDSKRFAAIDKRLYLQFTARKIQRCPPKVRNSNREIFIIFRELVKKYSIVNTSLFVYCRKNHDNEQCCCHSEQSRCSSSYENEQGKYLPLGHDDERHNNDDEESDSPNEGTDLRAPEESGTTNKLKIRLG